MAYNLQGSIQNAFPPESGVNLTIKKLEDEKIVLQPQTMYNFEKEEKTLSFTLTPSSGVIGETRDLTTEVKNGTDKIEVVDNNWNVEITGDSDKEPTPFGILFYYKVEEEEEAAE